VQQRQQQWLLRIVLASGWRLPGRPPRTFGVHELFFFVFRRG
jgi:hypothetical protein